MGSTASADQKKRLGAGLITFIIVDVVLVLVAMLMLTGVMGPLSANANANADAGKAKSPATDYTSGGAGSATPKATPMLLPGSEVFASPSRNITCTMVESSARCVISSLSKKPAKAAGCELRIGYVAVLDPKGVEMPCEQVPSAATQDVRTLAYNETVTVGDYTCASTREGMKCSDREAGRGFTIARAGIQTF